MTKREKELEELIKDLGEKWSRFHESEAIELMAEDIQSLGYTKTPFDIEELKRWLEEEIKYFQNALNKYPNCDTILSIRELSVRKEIYQEFLDKIKELEEE
jgi:hypothetical protein